MSSKNLSPNDRYWNVENEISPLLRKRLSELLPKINKKSWWKDCVIAALPEHQRGNFNLNVESFDQFDFPALFLVFAKNKNPIQRLLGVGDELISHLHDIRNLRNKISHANPSQVYDENEIKHVEESARLAKNILLGVKPEDVQQDIENRKQKERFLKTLGVGSVVAIVALGAWYLNGAEDRARAVCAKNHYLFEQAKKYEHLADVYKIFARERGHLDSQCLTVENLERVNLSGKDRKDLRQQVEKRLAKILDPLRTAYQHLVNKGVLVEKRFDESLDVLTAYVKKLQRFHNQKSTGIPNAKLLEVIASQDFPVYASDETIDAGRAFFHIGGVYTVCGAVKAIHFYPKFQPQVAFINLGKPYPHQDFAVVLPKEHFTSFQEQNVFFNELIDQRLCVKGKIAFRSEDKNASPHINVQDVGDLSLEKP